MKVTRRLIPRGFWISEQEPWEEGYLDIVTRGGPWYVEITMILEPSKRD
jgi:hypothetical protein